LLRLSTLDAPAYEVLVRRAAKVVLEDALYPVRTTSYDPGEIGDSDAGLQRRAVLRNPA